jgi:hypothetical protein
MKRIFLSSLTCAITSLLGFVAMSAITFVPSARVTQQRIMVGVLVSLAFWLSLAIWARMRMRASETSSVGLARAGRVLMFVALAYVLGFFLCVIG